VKVVPFTNRGRVSLSFSYDEIRALHTVMLKVLVIPELAVFARNLAFRSAMKKVQGFKSRIDAEEIAAQL
jgi:hypothetical protein